jgi:hypothetical protein
MDGRVSFAFVIADEQHAFILREMLHKHQPAKMTPETCTPLNALQDNLLRLLFAKDSPRRHQHHPCLLEKTGGTCIMHIPLTLSQVFAAQRYGIVST